MKKLRILFLILCSTWWGCKKKEIANLTNSTPVFIFEGTIGSDYINYQAGVDGLYMHTDFFKDYQSITALEGRFARQDCDTCQPYLSFVCNDKAPNPALALVSTPEELLAISAFNSRSFDKVFTSDTIETFFFTPDTYIGTTASYFWDFGDGSTSTAVSPSHTYLTAGVKNVKLRTVINGFIDSVTVPIDVTKGSTCRSNFNLNKSSDTVYVSVLSSTFILVNWDFGDGTTGTGTSSQHHYTNPGNYQITMTATDGLGCSVTSRKNVHIDTAGSSSSSQYVSNFNYSTSTTTSTVNEPRLNARTCVITYKSQGKTYVSYKNDSTINQSMKPILKIISYELYQNNIDGDKTIRVSSSVDTYLYNILNNNDSLRIKSNKIFVGLAIP